MITLHQFARAWGIPNLSPFRSKLEAYLRMAGVPYRTADALPPMEPKRKSASAMATSKAMLELSGQPQIGAREAASLSALFPRFLPLRWDRDHSTC